MIHIQDFHPRLASELPATHTVLRSSNLTVHKCVSRVTLHGSRGLAKCHRNDSDIDLSLIVDGISDPDLDLLYAIFQTTARHWRSDIELDLAVVFAARACQLKCFGQSLWDPQVCSTACLDCFGLYKIGKGFNGLVTEAGIQVERMYPCLQIWQRE